MSSQNYRVELAVQARSTIGEGPVWHAEKRRLYWVDIIQNKFNIYDPQTKQNKTVDVGSHIGCVVPDQTGGYVAGLKNGIARFTLSDDESTVATLEYLFKPPESEFTEKMRFNDGKCDPHGRLWAGTMDMLPQHQPVGRLYMMDKNRSVQTKETGIYVSNGLGWSTDMRTMFYIDTGQQQIWAYSFDAATGAMADRRTCIAVPPESGRPDGMTVDADGKIWLTHYTGGRVTRWDPETGQLLFTVQLPDAGPLTTSLCFGGEDLQDLYVTSATARLSEAERRDLPLAGSLFVVRGLGVRGRPEVPFAG